MRLNNFRNLARAAAGCSILLSAGAQAAVNSGHWISSYSTLEDSACNVQVRTEEHYQAVCKGVAGYKLSIDNSERGLSIAVIDPRGESFDLSGVSAGYVADMAEWHGPIRKGKLDPEALILQIESPAAADPSQLESSLLVVRLNESGICATRLLARQAGSSELARLSAKAARAADCLPSSAPAPAL